MCFPARGVECTQSKSCHIFATSSSTLCAWTTICTYRFAQISELSFQENFLIGCALLNITSFKKKLIKKSTSTLISCDAAWNCIAQVISFCIVCLLNQPGTGPLLSVELLSAPKTWKVMHDKKLSQIHLYPGSFKHWEVCAWVFFDPFQCLVDIGLRRIYASLEVLILGIQQQNLCLADCEQEILSPSKKLWVDFSANYFVSVYLCKCMNSYQASCKLDSRVKHKMDDLCRQVQALGQITLHLLWS